MQFAHEGRFDTIPNAKPKYVLLDKIGEGWFENPDVRRHDCAFCKRRHSAYEAIHAEEWKMAHRESGGAKNGLNVFYGYCQTIVRNTNNRERPVFAHQRKIACHNPKCSQHIALDKRFNLEDPKIAIRLRKAVFK